MRDFKLLLVAAFALLAGAVWACATPVGATTNQGGPFLASSPQNFPTVQPGQTAMQLNQMANIGLDPNNNVTLGENDAGVLAIFGPTSATHLGGSAAATAPTLSYIAIATNGNPFDGGLALGTGSTDVSGTILATASSCTSCVVANSPLILMTPGTAPTSAYHCILHPSSATSAAAAPGADMYTEADGGGTLILFSATQTTTAAVWAWDYSCTGL